jgi:hypothetical protein
MNRQFVAHARRRASLCDEAVHSSAPTRDDNVTTNHDVTDTNDMGDDDFLSPGAAIGGVTTAALLERHRSELTRWGAGALLSRHPEVAPYKHVKGLLTCEGDLDFHVRHLHAALEHHADLGSYAPWVTEVLAQRQMSADQVRLGVAVLVEALYRFLPHPHGEAAAAPLIAAFGAAEVRGTEAT